MILILVSALPGVLVATVGVVAVIRRTVRRQHRDEQARETLALARLYDLPMPQVVQPGRISAPPAKEVSAMRELVWE